MENRRRYRVAVFGAGYVGLSVSIFLAGHHDVLIYDTNREKIEALARYHSTVSDPDIESYLSQIRHGKGEEGSFVPSFSSEEVLERADFVVIATPTDYDNALERLSIDSVRMVIREALKYAPQAAVIIRSTLPTGAMKRMHDEFPSSILVYVPEFLREGSSLKDERYPERFIVGLPEDTQPYQEAGKRIVELFEADLNQNIHVQVMSAAEAEAVKLFSNAYLAMRVAFFNELDSFSEINHLRADQIIRGVCADPRIGDYYNQPSFGYGGYCLPKDTKELRRSFEHTPERLISSIVLSNQLRKAHIAGQIIKRVQNLEENEGKGNVTVGIYRLNMKRESDNCRGAAILDIISILQQERCKLIIYENTIPGTYYKGIEIQRDLRSFKDQSHLIVANRTDNQLQDVMYKVYTRDVYCEGGQ